MQAAPRNGWGNTSKGTTRGTWIHLTTSKFDHTSAAAQCSALQDAVASFSCNPGRPQSTRLGKTNASEPALSRCLQRKGASPRSFASEWFKEDRPGRSRSVPGSNRLSSCAYCSSVSEATSEDIGRIR